MTQYSEAFKSKMVQRMAGPAAISASRLAQDVGIGQPTLSKWRRDAEGRIRGVKFDSPLPSSRSPRHPATLEALGSRRKTAGDGRKVRELEKQLRRKDKALAEAAALLVLQKKSKPSGGTRTTTRSRRATNDPATHR